MLKKLLNWFKVKQKAYKAASDPVIPSESSDTPEVSQSRMEQTSSKNRSVVVFDAQRRIFVVKKRVAHMALYNPDAGEVIVHHLHQNEDVITIPEELKNTAFPIAGYWSDQENCQIGFFIPAKQGFYLLNNQKLTPIRVNLEPIVGIGPYEQMQPLSGFWYGSDIEQIALYDRCAAVFVIKGPTQTPAIFQYGPLNNQMQALRGDWTGEGKHSVGLYDAENGIFYLKRSLNSKPEEDWHFYFGPPNSSMIPIVGDWDGSGCDKVGLYSPEDGLFFLSYANATPPQPDTHCYFGPAFAHLKPFVGDWSGQGHDGLAVYDAETGIAYLKYNCSGGSADRIVVFSRHERQALPVVHFELN